MGRHLQHLFTGFVALALVLPGAAAAMENEDCLICHSEAATVGMKRLIDPVRFDHTAHSELGCLACHETVTDQHPDDGIALSKAVCRACHEDMVVEYQRTGHAANAACDDCHNPHTVLSTSEVSGTDMNRQCGICHAPDIMADVHGVWLPQAGLHLEMLPCISCHSGSENYAIVLYVTLRGAAPESASGYAGPGAALAGFEELQALAGERSIDTLIDTDGDGLATLKELIRFNTSPNYRNLRLKGMLTPEVVTHNLQILDNRWDCTFCHASGPGAMQSSTLALPQKDGSYARLPVEQGAVLDALYGTPDFYMMGATRSMAMNIAGLVLLSGGLVMPVGHGLLRWLTRSNRHS